MAQAKIRRDAEYAATEAEDKRLRAAIQVCRDHFEELPAKERDFIRSMETSFRHYTPPSEAQSKWLYDLASRYADPQVVSPASQGTIKGPTKPFQLRYKNNKP